MSSLRGATGAGKPKAVNVNSIYAGRNLAQGARPLGKHGLTSVGKSVGVVRRMPPPATLPSLKAENNGQDPNIAVVPQGGTGWNKAEVPTTAPEVTNKVVQPTVSNGPDLRPTWAKPTSASESAPKTSNREFPSLAVSSQGKDAKPQNAWATGSTSQHSDRASLSQSCEDDRQLPARYYDSARQQSNNYRSRFQSSSDVRSSQPTYYSRNASESCDDGKDVRSDSSSNVTVSVENQAVPTPAVQVAATQPEFSAEETEQQRATQVEKSRQKRDSYRNSVNEESNDCRQSQVSQNGVKANGVAESQPRRWAGPAQPAAPVQPEYRLLKRPERIELEDISDDDDDVQMTKLNKPAIKVMKRAPGAGADIEEETKDQLATTQENSQVTERVQAKHSARKSDVAKASESEKPATQSSQKEERRTVVPEVDVAPPPAENIWAKRKEERESQSKDKVHMPKAVQHAIEQHFPSVNEAAKIKVDKEAVRHSSDQDYTRAAMIAARRQQSNDVRQALRAGNSERRQSNRDRQQVYENRERQNGPRRDMRDRRPEQEEQYVDDRDRREQPREQREYRDNRDNYERRGGYGGGRGGYERRQDRGGERGGSPNEEVDEDSSWAPQEYTNSRGGSRRGFPTRGRAVRGAYVRGGRGARSAYAPQHQQYSRRPYIPRDRENEEGNDYEKSTEASELVEGIDAIELKNNSEKPSDSVVENHEEDSEARQHFSQRQRINTRGRGRGERRGRGGYNQNPREHNDSRAHNTRGSEDNAVGQEEETRDDRRERNWREEAGERGAAKQYVSSRGRGRGANREHYQPIPQRQQRERKPAPDAGAYNKKSEHVERLKSPVVSSEGHDEWETASEGSQSQKKEQTSRRLLSGKDQSRDQRRSAKPHMNGAGDGAQTRTDEQRLRSKNGPPARRMCRSPSADGSRSKPVHTRQPPKNKVPGGDGLAGLDLANVVIVDQHMTELSGDADDFEEVMNKKTRKQRLAEQLAKEQAEERARQREKERMEKLQARRVARLNIKKEAKKLSDEKRKSIEKKPDEATKSSSSKSKADKGNAYDDVPTVTTVWNSAHVEAQQALSKENAKESVQTTIVRDTGNAVIPSPIARPTPRSKSAASENPPASNTSEPVRGGLVELPLALSSSQPLRVTEKYDFSFDANLHEAQLREAQEKAHPMISTANSEAGSAADDFRLEEKLNKVKGLWSGEADSSAMEPPLPVAKVKPQPQNGTEPAGPAETHKEHNGTNGHQVPSTRSPGINAFSNQLGLSMFHTYPLMDGHFMPPHGNSMMPPGNATSPPSLAPPAPYGQPQQHRHQPHIYMQRTWAPNAAGPLEMFNNTPPPQNLAALSQIQPPLPPQQSQFAFAQSRSAQQPPTQRGMVPTAGPGAKVGGAPVGVGPPGGPYPPMVEMMHMPPPNMTGSVGNQRDARMYQQNLGGSVGGMGVAGPPGHGVAQSHPPPPQNFSRPPPMSATQMRYSQPPPLAQNEMCWTKPAPPPPNPNMAHFYSGPNRGSEPSPRAQHELWVNGGGGGGGFCAPQHQQQQQQARQSNVMMSKNRADLMKQQQGKHQQNGQMA